MTTQKIRHKFLTAWLVFLLFGNSLFILFNLCNSLTAREIDPNIPVWLFPYFILDNILRIIFVIALFRWKKWGFWGFVATTFLSFITSLLTGLSFVSSISGFLSALLLFGALQIGKEHKGWTQLE